MSGTYMTTFNGEISLVNTIDESIIAKIKAAIEKRFSDLMNLDEPTKILYIKGAFDNSEESMEKFMSKILPVVDLTDGEVTIKAQGDTPSDRWDLIIMSDGVYIQEYVLVKGDLRKYST